MKEKPRSLAALLLGLGAVVVVPSYAALRVGASSASVASPERSPAFPLVEAGTISEDGQFQSYGDDQKQGALRAWVDGRAVDYCVSRKGLETCFADFFAVRYQRITKQCCASINDGMPLRELLGIGEPWEPFTEPNVEHLPTAELEGAVPAARLDGTDSDLRDLRDRVSFEDGTWSLSRATLAYGQVLVRPYLRSLPRHNSDGTVSHAGLENTLVVERYDQGTRTHVLFLSADPAVSDLDKLRFDSLTVVHPYEPVPFGDSESPRDRFLIQGNGLLQADQPGYVIIATEPAVPPTTSYSTAELSFAGEALEQFSSELIDLLRRADAHIATLPPR